MTSTLILRISLAVVLLSHGIPSVVSGSVNDFGKMFLDQIGFSPFGVLLAWGVKLSHIVCALCFLLNRFIKPAAIVTIFILVMGIITVHFKEGWFVVGGGRNGMEYNFVLITILLALLFPNAFQRKPVEPTSGQPD